MLSMVARRFVTAVGLNITVLNHLGMLNIRVGGGPLGHPKIFINLVSVSVLGLATLAAERACRRGWTERRTRGGEQGW